MSKRQGIVRPLGLALVLAIGLGAVLALAVSWGIAIWQGLRPNRVISETLIILPDDTPVINRYVSDSYPGVTYRTWMARSCRPPRGAFLSSGRLSVNAPPRRPDPIGRRSPHRAILRTGRSPPNYWYFLHDGACDGRGYFVGYSLQSKLRVGFIGHDGLRPDQPPVQQWFPVDGVKKPAVRQCSTTGLATMTPISDSPDGGQS